MDFDAGTWDVENEAKELDRSLFESTKKKSKHSMKRKFEEEIKHQNSVKNKKKKTTIDAGKVEEIGIVEKRKKDKTIKTSKAEVNKPIGRKERRNKIWQEKIMKRKEMGEKNEAGGLNKGTETDREFVSTSDNEVDKTLQNGKVQTENISSSSRFEKRKLKWEKLQKLKSQKMKQNNSNDLTGFDVKSDTQNKVNKVSEVVGENDNTNELNLNQMNRKEKRKQKRKQKSKERKLKNKTSKNDMNELAMVSSENKSKLEDDEVFEKQGEKVGKSNLKNKNKKKDRKSLLNLNEIGKTDVERLGSVKKNESPLTDRESASAGINNMKEKRKRKRVCKKNKFKGYVKPERKQCSELPESDLENTRQQNENVIDRANEISTASPVVSDVITKKKKDKKKIPERKQETVLNSTLKEAEHNISSKGSGPKIRKKNAFNPETLKAILYPDSKTKALGNTKSVEDDDDNIASIPEDRKNDKTPKSLLEKSKERLNAARFRYLNEQLYTRTGQEAFEMFKNDKEAFSVYHEGFQGQVEKWPTNPVDVIISKIRSKPKHLILADFGCGDAKLARSIPNKVHSFDLVALNDRVTVCNMSKVPLPDDHVDIAVFCLSLMGTNLAAYLKEANRIIKHNGTLMIAEVNSRFDNMRSFIMQVEKMGFKLKLQDSSNKMFVMMEYKKTASIKNSRPEDIQLKPCVYKKR